MKAFDLDSHYSKLVNSKTEIERILIQKEMFNFLNSLSKEEQDLFKAKERDWRNTEFSKISEEFNNLKLEMV